METLWMDSGNNLAALVSTDAEFDHFEAVRDDYESALSKFVASAARDEMAALSEMSQKMPGRRTGTFAFVGATLIDGTGKPPIPNATVVTSNGKIVAAGPSASVQIPADAQRISVTRQVHHSRACGTCTRTTSRWSGGRSISPRGSPRCAMWAMNTTSSRGARCGQQR